MKLTKLSKKNIADTYDNLFVPYKRLTCASKKCILEIQAHICDGRKVIKKLFKQNQINVNSRTISIVADLPKPINFQFIPRTIQHTIEIESREIVEISTVMNDKHIHIYFIENKRNTKENYKDCATNMLNWLFVAEKYASKQCSRSLFIYVYMTDLKKTKPLPGQTITPLNVNTGLTTSCPVDAEIVIFRKEEWFKVFIHETFHSFGLDFSGFDTTKCDKHLREFFHTNIQFNAFEAYTEMWAEIVNAIFCSNSFKLENIDHFINIFEKCLNVERQHSFTQMVNILDHMSLRYKQLIKNAGDSNYKKEQTSIFAYFILKTILMYDFNLFLSWCNKKNKRLLMFDNEDENVQSFCHLFGLVHRTPGFLKIVKFVEDRHHYSDELRMTVCELS